MGAPLEPLFEELAWAPFHYMYFEDFFTDYAATQWGEQGDASGTFAVGDAANGIMAISPGATTDNDEQYIFTANEIVKPTASKPFYFEARVQYAEAATNAANVIVGVMDINAADTLIDNGGGPVATFDGFCFYKVDGGTVWKCRTSSGGSSARMDGSGTGVLRLKEVTAGGAAYQTLRIEFQPVAPTAWEVRYLVDGEVVEKHTISGATGQPVLANIDELNIVLGIKNGATAQETLNVDYCAVVGKR